MTWTLALRNLLRQPARSLTTLFAIVVGVASLILSAGFVRDIVAQLGEAFISSQTGHIQIAVPQYFASANRATGEVLLHDAPALRKAASAVPGVADVMGRLSFSGVLNNGRRDYSILGFGVEPAAESRLGTGLHIVAGRDLTATDEFGALLGEGLATALGVGPGEPLTLLASTPDGAMNTIDVEVVGTFRSFSKDFDARALRLPLRAAQTLLDTDGVNVLVLRLDETAQTDLIAQRLRQQLGPRLAVREWHTLSDFYEKTVALYRRQFGVLQLIVLAMVLLSVANSVNMSAFERIPEFGTLRALGTRNGALRTLILTETLVLGLVGAVLGAIAGMGLARLVSFVGIPMPPAPGSDVGYIAHISPAFTDVASAAAIGLVATVLAGIPPAVRCARLPITDALRRAI
ncbi:ABC transporter permease [Uliginosibacterium sp. sgz301328]|uniref:ABC transporter permease n=1 Tax=Uliginosibacterium sp. sgz301328 TaxID=3243764 RepID=UPI00359EAC6C